MDRLVKLFKYLGIFLMLFAIIVNPFFIEYFFSPDKKFDFAWKYFVVLSIDLVIFFIGVIHYFFAKKNSQKFLLLYSSLVVFIFSFSIIILLFSHYFSHRVGVFIEDNIFYWVLNPSHNSSSQGFNEEYLNFDELEAEKTVYLIGDSFTYGHFIDYKEAFATIVDSNIPKYNFVNLGVPGYDISQYNLMIQKYSEVKKPKAVVLNIYLGNDFFTNEQNKINAIYFFDTLGIIDRKKTSLQVLLDFFSKRFLPQQINRWKDGRFTEDFYSFFIRNESSASKKIYSFEEEIDINESLKNLHEIINFTSEKDIELVVVLHPHVYQVKPDFFQEILEKYNDDLENFEIFKPQRIFKEFFDLRDVRYIDLAPVFAEKDPEENLYLKLDGHYNKAGNALASEVITAKLKEMNFLGIENEK